MATLVVTDDSDKRVRTRDAAGPLRAAGHPRPFTSTCTRAATPFIFGPETRRITGTERLRDDVCGATFLISPTAFFQTNVRAAEILVRLVLEAVPADATVLDLYAGAGLFALPLARVVISVIAVEANPTAVADGEASLRLNRIPAGALPLHREAGEQRSRAPSPIGSRAAAVVILDPPREGCEAVGARRCVRTYPPGDGGLRLVQPRDARPRSAARSCGTATQSSRCSPWTCFRTRRTSRQLS